MNLRRLASGVGALTVLACAACGGKSLGSGASGTVSSSDSMVTGTVGGASFAATDAVSIVSPASSSATSPELVSIALTNFADACAAVGPGSPPANGAVVVISVLQGAAGQAYPIDGRAASVSYGAQFSGQCHTFTSTNSTTTTRFAVFQAATSGSITFDAVSSASVKGSFDATFPSGDHLAGTFTAPNCPTMGQNPNAC
jgi:hypothetical protein